MNRMDHRRRRRPAPKKKKRKKRGCRSFFILIILILLVVFFVRKRSLPQEDFESKNPLTGHGRDEEVEEELRRREEELGAFPDPSDEENPGEDPVFGTYERENWIKNLKHAVKHYPNAQIILDHADEIQEPLLKLAGNDYSAIDFVAKTIDPSVENDYEYPSNINGGKYPYYIQWDKRWGYDEYAKGIVGYTGCGPTSAAMVLSGLLKDDSITPDQIAKISEENGFSNANGTSWKLYPFLANRYGLQIEQITPNYEQLKAHLDTGNPALVSVGPGQFTSEGHVMVIVGTDLFGRLIINDPNNRENSESRWKWEEIAKEVKTIWTVKP